LNLYLWKQDYRLHTTQQKETTGEVYLKNRVKTLTKGVKVGAWLGKTVPVRFPLFEFAAKNLSAEQRENPQE
jgi:hypothetical protein